MIYAGDLQKVISQWLERMDNPSQPFEYKTALNECIDDLNHVIEKSIEEELDYKDAIESWEADNFLASLEAHEAVA